MSLLEIGIDRIENRAELIIEVIDIHPDARNINIILRDRESYESELGLAPFVMGLLLSGADNRRVPAFIKEFEKREHLSSHGNLEDFDENEEFNYTEAHTVYDEKIINHFIVKTELVELIPTDFWENYHGQEYDYDELPTAKIRVTLKSDLFAEKFDGLSWQTAYDITQ